MSAPEQARKPRRIWLKMVIGVVLVVLVLAGWLVIERQRGKAALAKYEKELIAKGEKLTFAELIPPTTEGASELTALCKALQDSEFLTVKKPLGMELVAPGKARSLVKESRVAPMWQQVKAELGTNAVVLQELRRMIRHSPIQFPIVYQGENTAFPHLPRCWKVGGWFSISGIYHLCAEDLESAVDDIETIALLSAALESDPFLESQFVRMNLASTSLNNCWAILQANTITDGQLARLQTILRRPNFIDPMMKALRGQRIMKRDTVRSLRAGDIGLMAICDSPSSTFIYGEVPEFMAREMESFSSEDVVRDLVRTGIMFPMWRFVQSYEDERFLLGEVQMALIAADRAKAQQSAVPMRIARQALDRKFQAGGPYQTWMHATTGLFVRRAIATGPLAALRCETRREMTVTALALKRYHLRHRKYPRNLGELVPEFLDTHPVDWMDGQPLRYRINADSFVLWSVGDNGIDEGGTPDQSGPYYLFYYAPDFVWPHPASAADIKAHNESLESLRRRLQ